MIAIYTGWDPTAWEILAQLSAGIGAILTLVGWALLGWSQQISSLIERISNIRDYYRLYPLWEIIISIFPHIVLPLKKSLWKVIPRPDFYVHRRIVEINDGKRELRGSLDSSSISDIARKAQAINASAEAIEAAHIHAATERHRLTPRTEFIAPSLQPEGMAERTWLLGVASKVNDPVVLSLLPQLGLDAVREH